MIFNLGSLAAMMVVPLLSVRFWPDVDHRLCPKSIPCHGECLVDADPDIAGIGVGRAQNTPSD